MKSIESKGKSSRASTRAAQAAAVSPDTAAQGGPEASSYGVPSDAPSPVRPQRPGKRAPGAPRGNRHAERHGAYLSEEKRTARELRDRHRRKAEDQWREILGEYGLGSDALARSIASQGRRLETLASRLESYVEARGIMRKGGEVQPAALKLLDVVKALMDQAGKLMEKLAETRRPPATETVYVVSLHDGRDLDDAQLDTHGIPAAAVAPGTAPASEADSVAASDSSPTAANLGAPIEAA